MLSCMPRAGSRPHSTCRTFGMPGVVVPGGHVIAWTPSWRARCRRARWTRPARSRPGRAGGSPRGPAKNRLDPPPCRSHTPPHHALCAEGAPLASLSLSSPSLSLPPPSPSSPPTPGATRGARLEGVSRPSRGPRRVLNSGASSPGPQLDAPLFRTRRGPREGPQSRRRV